jgi:competence ComEA-like helix-hairpin-helix protein
VLLKYIFFLSLILSNLFAIVDINNAKSDELLELNGIGKAKAQKILDYRELNGCFKSVDELARVDGVSKKIISSNRGTMIVGTCKVLKKEKVSSFLALKEVLLNRVNIFFSLMILLLAFLDIKTGKDFKSQIISMGVLGTFVGVFIGLQGFDPEDIANSVNDILSGLKTAFFTSIVGMSVSTILSITQELKANPEKK